MLRHRHGGDFDPPQGARRARCFGLVSGEQRRGGPKSSRRGAGAQRAMMVAQRGREPLWRCIAALTAVPRLVKLPARAVSDRAAPSARSEPRPHVRADLRPPPVIASVAKQSSVPRHTLVCFATLATTALAWNPVSRRFKRIIERFPVDRRLRLAGCGIHAAHGQITPIATVRNRRHSSEVAAALGQSTRHIRRRDVPSQATTVAVSPGTSIVIEPSSSASSRRIPARCPAVQRLASVGPEKSSALPATSSRCSA